MSRGKSFTRIVTPETLASINPENARLRDDYLIYLKSAGRADSTIGNYRSDLNFFFVWNALYNGNKFFVDLKKRDIVAFQSWMINERENSPARIKKVKSTLSSLSNYIENILDDEYEDFRSIINKIESPVSQPVREKTILTDEQADLVLNTFVQAGKYREACFFALARWSGRRKSELTRFKVSYFEDKNIIYNSLYRTPEKIRTKGKNNGKMLTCYVLAKPFKPYFDKYMEWRKQKGIESEWLFFDKNDPSQPIPEPTIRYWAVIISKMLNVDFYWHAMRHMYTTALIQAGLPIDVVQFIIGWESADMVAVYDDTDRETRLKQFFKDGEIVSIKPIQLSEL